MTSGCYFYLERKKDNYLIDYSNLFVLLANRINHYVDLTIRFDALLFQYKLPRGGQFKGGGDYFEKRTTQ